jgi:hypothetical protein
MEKNNFAQGIFITEKKSKDGKIYLAISVKEGENYKKFVAFKGQKEDKFGGIMYVVYNAEKKEETPF